MKVDVVDSSRKPVEKIELDDTVFGAEVKQHLLHEVVVAQLAAVRAGTACTKNRSEVNGAKSKIYRQKGTGRARMGALRTNVRRGGPAQFGPKPRSFERKVNKKVRVAALRSALSMKAAEDKLLLVDQLKLDEPKTKGFIELMKGLGVSEGLLVLDQREDNLELGARNLRGFKVMHVDALNVYDLLDHSTLVMTSAAAEVISGRCRK
ncbi:MAG: 50S ribosomal protein L4 [Candidatus Alcyoniella australis]|nr:50S ribosomal protein L4 [Candidatus Alcyoniella australis]